MAGAMEPYAPLNVPKPFANDVWVVDGPEIDMDYGPFSLPFPTRMTVVRLSDRTLWIHSPIAPDEDLFQAVDALGEVRHLIAPNSIHYWYMADWLERYPGAASYAVPDLSSKAKRPFRIDHEYQSGKRFDWQEEIDWLLITGTKVTEAVFFARAARVLILADLIENFEPQRINNRLLRWLTRFGGANGSAPYDLRLTFYTKIREVRRQVGAMLAWPAAKVVMAHGRPYEQQAEAELTRAFRWAAPKD